ncbi:hypothetical protein GCM10010156_37500 [Planobispora rosea]|uniref:STAS domain-containing protein n=2 Tax=Planobispora rosea TaxID=35762 RepID=A0A8J3RUX0_PLARO|nr:hypothetical protein GCM10010156_37500 [Planobispora rosea]GIH81825.1 hypothetical protein Pro02_02330 [Planobispora rosea]
MMPVNRSPSASGGPHACVSVSAPSRPSRPQGHSLARLAVVRSTVMLPHEDASRLPASESASSGVLGAVLYADRLVRLTYHPQPGATLIRLTGQIDATNHAALEETLRRVGHGEDRLLIDLRDLHFIDTAGMRLLVRLCSTGAARLVNVPPFLQHLTELLNLPLRISAPDGPAAETR